MKQNLQELIFAADEQAIIPERTTARHERIATISAALISAIGAAGCNGQNIENDDLPPQIVSSESALALKDLNPPAAPVVLPIANGRVTRISQKGYSSPSHLGLSTAHAIDLATEGDFVAPVSGVVTLNQGNCRQNPDRTTLLSCNDRCNGDWGNLIGLDGLDGRKFIGAHCDSFAPGLQTGSFVLTGTPLCEIGCTGHADGVHSHFDKTTSTQRPIESQGVDSFITAVQGHSPSIETPGTANKPGSFVTCCRSSGCTEYGATPADCQHAYVSFNKPLAETLSATVRQMQSSDENIRQIIGGIEPDRNSSNATWTVASQRIKYATPSGEVSARILFYTGSFFGNGTRNPFITAGWSKIVTDNGSGAVLKNWTAYTQVHSEDFRQFDLYELMMAHVMPTSREAVAMPMPTQVDSFPNWSPDWELHRAIMPINGIDFHAYLAVLKRERGMRYGIYYNARDRIWASDGWTGL